MRITQLHLESFKSFKEPTVIDFAPAPLFFGANSAEKSFIVQALSYLEKGFNSLSPKEFESLLNAKEKTRRQFICRYIC
jgi:AAA15 family ATPase/GTPase